MLIFLQDNAIDLDDVVHRFALENILTSHYYGNCFALTKSRSLIKDILEDPRISDKAKKSAMDIKEKSTYSLKLIDGRLLYMTTSGMGDESPKRTNFGWHANISFFESGDLLEKPVFIAESLKDIDLYEYSGRHFLIKNEINRQLQLSFRENPGGGGSTYEMLKRVVRSSKSPTLCVVDSDKRSPNGSIKATAKNVERIDLRRESNQVYILPVRAAENTIPKQILSSVFAQHKTFIEDNFSDQNDLPFGYANLKYKNTFSMILDLTEESTKEDWVDWITRRNPNIKEGCRTHNECQKNNCTCYITPSFSEACLDKVKEYLTENAIHRTAKESDESIKGAWSEIGHLVSSYFAASMGVRIS